jgi:hypothetical protein
MAKSLKERSASRGRRKKKIGADACVRSVHAVGAGVCVCVCVCARDRGGGGVMR